MKVVIIGSEGQLGSELCRVFNDFEIVPLTHEDIEITNLASVTKTIAETRAELIINTAAFVRVDDCEAERDRAFSVNALGAANIAIASRQIGATLVHISTDYVFGKEGPDRKIPYSEFDEPGPLNVYGQSKLAGEKLVSQLCNKFIIVRTSGLFGIRGSSGKGGNFIETVLNIAKKGNTLRIVDDQIFSPTYAVDLAEVIRKVSLTGDYGYFHVTNQGDCSWFTFSREILKLAGLKNEIKPVSSSQYPQKARRPRFSVLGNYHLHLTGYAEMSPWQTALAAYMQKKGYLVGGYSSG